ncbi:hypothetical protein ACDA63_18385 [Uliginosibacterium sp. sgz301328]|uniref:hypothetical protein n=1 Tax=Uliginosibacterium sp. sgz301328 TaxID=3243764 RepID=UPI00359EEC2D
MSLIDVSDGNRLTATALFNLHKQGRAMSDISNTADGGDILLFDNPVWHAIEARIIAAFSDVRLEDGIGYFEANAKDDYLNPDDPCYQAERARDDRHDWMSLVRHIEANDGRMNECAHCFMDLKGLYFHLPVLLLTNTQLLSTYFLNPDTALLDLLTPPQWEILIDLYEYLVDYDWWIDHLMKEEETQCRTCGKIKHRESMTRAEAMAHVENSEDFKIWQILRNEYEVRFGRATSPARR